ncbi:BID domain-containing T4SS effector [Bartonella tribocorum]|uniref:BepH protein n=1 Tax=Bartonella tribocorum TaxID=85701 RepID=A0A2N9Y885_9HYPH|nr:BID domain-containing T4SS effector [Bartonella tribocorum]PIT67918.1 BepH protein [Bartonella tribocorum]
MKKHHPQPSATPEALYATVNKQNRGDQRKPTPEDEVTYASVSSVSPSRGRHHDQGRENSETIYAEVASPRHGEEVTYASVSSVSPSRGRHHGQGRENSETIYAEVASPRHGEEVTYASVSSVSPSRGRHHGQGRENPETTYAEVAPQQRGKSPSFTPEQVSAMLLKDPHVQAFAQEVMYWGKAVYGKDNIFQQHMQDILKDPSKGGEFSYQLAAEPESIHKFAGHQALGIKSPARREAEKGFPPLIDAIDNYTKAVETATQRLTQTPMAEQRRHRENAPQAERTHHHHRHHERGGQKQESPEHSPQRQRHGENKGMAFSM